MGELLGHYNVRQYVLFRDGYTCRCCGRHGKGVKLHVVKDCTENQSKFICGRVVDTVFIGSSSSLSKFDFKPDTVYDFIYEFDGRRGYLTDIKPTA